jgi:alpha-1,2-mannosyltransferase
MPPTQCGLLLLGAALYVSGGGLLMTATAAHASPGSPVRPALARAVLIAGLAIFAVALGGYLAFTMTQPTYRWLVPVDLGVYRHAGFVAAGTEPPYGPRLGTSLYDWPGSGLKFTYPPFAALVFTLLTLPKWAVLLKLSIGINIAALLVAIWVTLGGLGYRVGITRLGGALLLTGALLWTEPVQRTLYLGQIELLLMALILWDMCQPDRRWWKGAGVGVAAGIKLTPLVFIPWLLLTRRYRQAAVASGTFAATIALGFIFMPADSRTWWFDGVFLRAGRTGFIGWEGNQSLDAIITRFAGSIAAGKPAWLACAAVVLIIGLTAAALLDHAGHRVPAVLTCALTGLLSSPISWDHHWVWIAPAVTMLAVYAIRARGLLRWAFASAAVLVGAIFGAWPGFLWGQPLDLGGFWMGLIWIPPNTNPGTFQRLGDRHWYAEYHWHGWYLLSGNLYVLTGLALLAIAVAVGCGYARRGMSRSTRQARQFGHRHSATRPTAAPSKTIGTIRVRSS